jgi:GTP pyrophosphokinase
MPGRDRARFQWLRQLMEFQKDVADPDEFLDGVKVDLFSDEVYAFTPRGDLKVFPRGSTPVDFAYTVHSEIGRRCSGARINGVIAPLDYRLRNGDTVEIITSNSQEPSRDWLSFVQTSRARTRIRAHIRDEEHQRSLQLGRELLERQMHKRDLSYQRLVKSGEIDRAVKHFRLSNPDELLAQIGFGKLGAAEVVDALLAEANPAAERALKPGLIEKTVRKVTRADDKAGIVIGDVEESLVRFAKCCSPLPGDAVTGWITRGRGVTVHRRGCKRALELEPERRIECRWSSASNVRLPVTLRVVTADRPGILAHLSRSFNDGGVNIAEANCKASVNGRSLNTFQFLINDVAKLRNLMRSLQKIDGVYEVERL